MKIQRKRWVIMRNNRTEIFCGLASFESSWHGTPNFEIEAVEITETYEAVS